MTNVCTVCGRKFGFYGVIDREHFVLSHYYKAAGGGTCGWTAWPGGTAAAGEISNGRPPVVDEKLFYVEKPVFTLAELK